MNKNKQVSNSGYLLLVVLAAMVLIMGSNIVSCENVKEDHHVIGSDHRHHHKDGNNTKESHDGHLAHHRRRGFGNKKLEVGHGGDGHVVPKRLGCSGDVCLTLLQDCEGECWCAPAFIFSGICVGSCC